MNNQNVISVENIGKKFCKDLKLGYYYGITDIFREVFGQGKHEKLRKEEFWALQDINFALKKGEMLGIVGPNGAGKSTLLKVITGLMRPDTGIVRINSNLQALIELGSGFNPLLSGRENIKINAAVLGLSSKQIKEQIDEIIEFSELGDFIDSPIRNYSSGMISRLAFSVAITMKPEILILDEVFAVGDGKFLRKSIERMTALLRGGLTLIYVSHSIWTLQQFCKQGIYVNKGGIKYLGGIQEAIEAYYNECILPPNQKQDNHYHKRASFYLEDFLEIKSFDYVRQDNAEPITATFKMVIKAKKDLKKVLFAYQIFNSDRIVVTSFMNNTNFDLKAGEHEITCHVKNFNLLKGVYSIGLAISEDSNPIYVAEQFESFKVEFKLEKMRKMGSESGIIYFDSEWEKN